MEAVIPKSREAPLYMQVDCVGGMPTCGPCGPHNDPYCIIHSDITRNYCSGKVGIPPFNRFNSLFNENNNFKYSDGVIFENTLAV